MTVAYLDSSAVVKLCVREAETDALVAHLRTVTRTISSELTLVEVARAASRALGEVGLIDAEAACARLAVLPVTRPIIDRARRLGPPALRTSDALHLATALEPRTQPVVVSYDERLLAAAAGHGLDVASPGR